MGGGASIEEGRAGHTAAVELVTGQLRIVSGLHEDEAEAGLGDTFIKESDWKYSNPKGLHLCYRRTTKKWVLTDDPAAGGRYLFCIAAPKDAVAGGSAAPALPAGLRVWSENEGSNQFIPRKLAVACGPPDITELDLWQLNWSITVGAHSIAAVAAAKTVAAGARPWQQPNSTLRPPISILERRMAERLAGAEGERAAIFESNEFEKLQEVETRIDLFHREAAALQMAPETAHFLVSGANERFDGLYRPDPKHPVVNNRRHYSSEKDGHIYYVPSRALWVIRNRCIPWETYCSLYVKTPGSLPTGSHLWKRNEDGEWTGTVVKVTAVDESGESFPPPPEAALEEAVGTRACIGDSDDSDDENGVVLYIAGTPHTIASSTTPPRGAPPKLQAAARFAGDLAS